MVRRRAGAVRPTAADPGAALRAAAFDPLRAAAGPRRRLLLSPDGDLTRLPFEALPSAGDRRLLDDYQLSYVACGRDVLRFGTPAEDPSDPVVAADPDFDLGGTAARKKAPAIPGRRSRDLQESSLSFPRLPGTRAEGERVAALLGVRPWVEGKVVEKRLKAVRSPRVLHLATHGFFLSDQDRDASAEDSWVAGEGLGRLAGLGLENPLLRSGLALAGSNTWLGKGTPPAEAEDGLLTAEDVSGMDLSDTELVVLSACDTGLGEVRTGEGVFGLRRAFALAGARALVMSLWKVPDEQTRDLMEGFYQRALQGTPVAEALRQAQAELRSRHPDPVAWAAFVCLGDPDLVILPSAQPA
jgi:CHAT domain-containing protein